jgi:pimeloyl-ACP methyl ester carboxylesterase
MNSRLIRLSVLVFAAGCQAQGIDGGQAVPGTAFRRHVTEDRLGRRIDFFVSRPDTAGARLPVVVWVQGSGCSSLFGRADDRITVRSQALVHEVVRGRAAVVAVEKPGVHFLDQPPDPADSRTCRPEFLREHTLDRWTEAIVASIKAVHRQAGIDASRTLVIGASEGGLVAVRVSSAFPAVTHVASLAGGGPAHLFDLAEFMRRRHLNPEKEVYDCWADIRREPDTTTKFCWGHPYRELSSFLKTSLIEECVRSHAKLYLVHGTADEQNFVAGFDVLRAELAVRQRPAVFERIDGADHGMNTASQSAPEGLVAVLERIVDWFVKQ